MSLEDHTLPLIRRAARHGARSGGAAVADDGGERSYAEVLDASVAVAEQLLDTVAGETPPDRDADGGNADGGGPAGPPRDLGEARVAYMVDPGFGYVAVQWGIWLAGGVAVPLCVSHPEPELTHVVDDAGASVIVAGSGHGATLEPLAGERGLPLLGAEELIRSGGDSARQRTAGVRDGPDLPGVRPGRRAMILYTSGTTGRPKGVVHTHANLEAQIRSLVDAWHWRPEDRILHVLPLHHTHGILNALLCALWSGATVEFLPRFDAEAVWERFAEGRVNVFMAVPTIYVRLLRSFDDAGPEERALRRDSLEDMRLMVSGSAALPVTVFERWEEVAGEPLLERYGMTEIGMALSNPLHGERRPGHVGKPLPGVKARLVDEDAEIIGELATGPDPRSGGSGSPGADRGPSPGRRGPTEGVPGEIEIRGPGVCLEYWRRPAETREAFRGEWFRTGDEAEVRGGYWRILGRKSVDIIMTGGYKVSALEVEGVLRRHPAVDDCAVVGVEDPEWGELVSVAVELTERSGRSESSESSDCSECSAADLTLEELRAWAGERLAPYKVPRALRVVDALPRNAMGKVWKPQVRELFAEEAGTEAT